MTSREALENIKRERPTYFSTLYDLDMWKEDIKIIEKDLEVLELIKKEFGGFIGYFLEDYLGELELNYNQVKIREWLEND